MRYHNALLLAAISTAVLLPSAALGEVDTEQTSIVQTLLAMDHSVIQAFLAGDADGYSEHLSDEFFMFQSGYRATKDYAIGMVGAIDCDVSDPMRLSKPEATRVNDNAYVLSYRMDVTATCASGDVAITLPTPVRAATLWVYEGDEWKIAYHGENPVVARDSPSETTSNATGASDKGASDKLQSNRVSTDSLTQTLLATESAVWETWRTQDANALIHLTSDSISFVNVFGDYFANKADAIAYWTDSFCDVDSFSLSSAVVTQVLPTIGVLTVTGSVSGTCGDERLVDRRVYATTVYVKEAESWKWAFGFNSR